MEKVIKLNHSERVVAVVPEQCSGPGWGNSPTWVYISTNDGRLRQECIQPEERSHELHTLFSSGRAVCEALLGAVKVKKVK